MNRNLVKRFAVALPFSALMITLPLVSACTSTGTDESNTGAADTGMTVTAPTQNVSTTTETTVPMDNLTSIERLGKKLLFDENLSNPTGVACATCHAPEVGFTGPDSQVNLETAVYPGAIHERFGNRKPPTAAYGGESPILYYDAEEEVWVGGTFWDGRATGMNLGDPLAEQAQGPFLNALEQNLGEMQAVCAVIVNSDYADLFKEVYGTTSLDYAANVQLMYDRIGLAIAAYEKSSEVSAFTSKFDAYEDGKYTLTALEQQGMDLFEDPEKGNCAACHPAPLFTDFTYDNLGVPKNPDNPFYTMAPEYNPDGVNFIDTGLGGFLKSAGYDEETYMAEWGKVKVPTLRNVDLRPDPAFIKSYAHNGFFKSLEDIVHFYNTRDIASENWPEPEVVNNVNHDELGDLGLTANEEAAIVAFLSTLSDGYYEK